MEASDFQNDDEKEDSDFELDTRSSLEIRINSKTTMTRYFKRNMLAKLDDMRVNSFCNLLKVMERVRQILNQEEIADFRTTVFGWLIDFDNISYVSGQLQLAFVANYVRYVNGLVDQNAMRFHIKKSVVSFTKQDLAIVTGLKLSGVKPVMSEKPTGDIWTRYLGGKTLVTRNDILKVLNKYKSTNEGTMRYDGVKLALLYVLSHGFLGNQTARPMEAYYLNLVDNLEDFKAYPWGEVVWNELRSYMKQSCEALENCTGTRVTFPGCMIALQVWAFETFPSLSKAGLCKVIEGREDIMPRTLKWAFHKKPSLEVFCELIFYNEKFEWTEIVPMEQELALIQEANIGDGQNLRNDNIYGGRVETEEGVQRKNGNGVPKAQKTVQRGRKKKPKRLTKTVESGRGNKEIAEQGTSKKRKKGAKEKDSDEDSDYKGEETEDNMDDSDVEAGGNKMIRAMRKQMSRTAKVMNDVKEMKKVQKKQAVMLAKIFRIVNDLSAYVVNKQEGGMPRHVENVVEEENIPQKDEREEECQKDEGNDKSTENIEKEKKTENSEDEKSETEKMNASEELNAGGNVDEIGSDMPNFNIFGFESQKESEEGNQEKLRPENDIEDDTEMEEHGEENETEDCKKEEEKIGEKEQEASTEVEEQREEIQTEVNNQEGQKGVVNDEKQMTNDATSYDMWGMGSQENSQFVKELCNSVDLIEKEALLRKSEGKPPTNIPTVLREKRIAKSPTRYTPAGQTADAKRRRKEKAKKRTHEEFLPPSRKIYGPFSEDPTDTPPADQMQRLANFLSIGMLKYRKKAEKDRRYRADEENMHGIPMLLDIMKIESKTWLYNLYSNEQWLNDQHMEVGMYYLSVKRLQYKLKQQYATNRAFFIQILRREHEKILKGQGTVHEAADDDEIMHSVQGSTSKFALHWCDCQFVYFPLNTGQHWVLLVLDIKNRKVRVYNSSSRRGDSLKDIRPFIPCIKVLLPKIMDYYNVHANSGEEPMGGKELQIEAVESCPQQTNAGDCGMFVLKIAEFLIMDMELDGIDADEMPMFRQKMATELVMYSEKRMSEAKGVQMPKFIRE